MKLLQGHAHKLGDRISTDAHVSARAYPLGTPREQLIAEMFQKIDPALAGRIKKGDFIVAGEFFGTRSTFDDAIGIMRAAGIAAVIAKSFGHLFFRCAVNCGLLAITANTDEIESGDLLKVDLSEGHIINTTKNLTLTFDPLPEFLLNIISDGGLVKHISRYGDYRVSLK